MAIMSAKQFITFVVSAHVSPLLTDEFLASEKPSTLPPRLHHCSGETEARAGRGFIEKRGELLTLAFFRIFLTVVDYIEGKVDDLLKAPAWRGRWGQSGVSCHPGFIRGICHEFLQAHLLLGSDVVLFHCHFTESVEVRE